MGVSVSATDFALVAEGDFQFADGTDAILVEGLDTTPEVLYADHPDRCFWLFPPGKVGEEFMVTLPKGDYGEGNPAQPVLAFTRVESPELEAAEIRENGAWVPIVAGSYHPDASTELRFSFSHPMDKASVEESLQGAEGLFTWESDSSVTVLIADPPPGIEWWGTHMRDTNGIWCPFTTYLYFGKAPHLCRYDPATGQEVELCEVPPDITFADISPDGMLVQIQDESAPGWESQRVVDTATGERASGEIHSGVSWREVIPDNVRASLDELVKGGNALFALSPDGFKLAVYHIPMDPPGRRADLSVLDTATGDAIAEYPDFAQVHWGITEVETFLAPADLLAWSPDSRVLAVVAFTGKDDQGKFSVRTVDTSTREVEDFPLDQAGGGLQGWSPDGKLWLVGCSLVDVRTLREVASFPAPPDLNKDWSWAAFGGGWQSGWCTIRDLASGQEVSLGSAFLAGWDNSGRFYFVRWTGSQWRHHDPPPEPKDESGK